jgi:hypothetical protein
LQSATTECSGAIDAFTVFECKAARRVERHSIGRFFERPADQIVDDVKREHAQAVINAAIVRLLLLVGCPPSDRVIVGRRPRQSGAFQCRVVDKSSEVFLAGSHERTAPKAADNSLQHGSVRLRVHEHHCVGTYGECVRGGTLYMYSVHKAGERVATLSLVRGDDPASLSEIRGPCNAKPPDKIVAVVKQWLRAQPRLPRSDLYRDPATADPHF